MDNVENDYLTNLSWLKRANSSKLQTTVECSNNHIDDELQCLCWLVKIRPISHSVKRLSISKNKNNYYRNLNHSSLSSYICNHSINRNDNSTSQRILNNHLSSSQQSFIFIRLSTGKISCLAIHHFV